MGKRSTSETVDRVSTQLSAPPVISGPRRRLTTDDRRGRRERSAAW